MFFYVEATFVIRMCNEHLKEIVLELFFIIYPSIFEIEHEINLRLRKNSCKLLFWKSATLQDNQLNCVRCLDSKHLK